MHKRTFFCKLPSRIWAAVLVCGLIGVAAAWAAPSTSAINNSNLNLLGQNSVIASTDVRYYAMPGSSEIQILNAHREVIGTLNVTDEHGSPVTVYVLHYSPAHHTLLVANASSSPADIYTVDPATGRANFRSRTQGDVRQAVRQAALMLPSLDVPQTIAASERTYSAPTSGVVIETRAERTHTPDPAYAQQKAAQAHGGSGSLDAVVGSLCNALVCVRIDEDGDFDIGTADGRSLLYHYPVIDPGTTDIRIFIDGNVYNLTSEVGVACSGTATFISWAYSADNSSIHVLYSIGSIGVEVIHTPVAFSATTAAILTKTVVTNNDAVPHSLGVLYHYDTDVDSDDFAELYLGPNHLLNESCFDAPYSVAYWDAVPASGTLVGRSTFTGGEAVTPDHLAFGNWPTYWNSACWDRVCIGDPYGDSAVLYQWDETTVPAGASRAVATYYGVGEVIVGAGELQISVVQPPLSCVAGHVVPDPMNLLVNITNTGESPCSDIVVTLADGTGPGGSAFITSPNPVTIPTLNPGANAAINFVVDLFTDPAGGCINFDVSAAPTVTGCTPNALADVCVSIPACEAPPSTCGPMDIVFAVDVTGSMGGAIGNVVAELPNIMATAATASGGDVRFGLLTFHDQVHVLHNLTANQAVVVASITGLAAGGGDGEPEASDETLREIITQDALCTDGSEFTSAFRPSAVKIVVLVTDARPGGCDDAFAVGVDDVNAHHRAVDALAANVLISAVYVPTWPDFQAEIIPIMNDYANTTGGAFSMVNSDGSGTGAAIASIIEHCGSADECEGPHCSPAPAQGYTAISGLIADAVVQMTENNEMKLSWTPVEDADFYQVYMGAELDAPQNWAPVGTPLEPTLIIPQEILDRSPAERTQYFYVQAKQVSTEPIASDLACWPMEEGSGTLVEDMAQDHDGTIHGADWTTGPSGHPGLHFEYGDYVQVNNEVEFYGQPLQVEACVSIEQYPTVQTGAYFIFSCHRYSTWFQGFGLRIDVNGRLLSEVWDETIHNWRTLWAPPNKQVPLNESFLVTAVINGNNSMLLLNGDVVAAGVQKYNSITNGFNMTIGAHNYNADRYQYHMRGDIHWLKVSQF